MKLTQIVEHNHTDEPYNMPWAEYEKSEKWKGFRLISRVGGATYLSLGAFFLSAAAIIPDAPWDLWAVSGYLLMDGIGDLVSGRHHYLPFKAVTCAGKKLYSLLTREKFISSYSSDSEKRVLGEDNYEINSRAADRQRTD
jgi:hypothetical protein